MSKITENELVNKARGKMSDQFMYRTRGENTFISKLPKRDKTKAPHENQVRVRDKFSDAQQYARVAISDPDLKAEYQQHLPSGKAAYNAALKDYLTAPEVQEVDTAAYEGIAGNPIVVLAVDDFRVVEVSISIHTASGLLVEEGFAQLSPVFRRRWTYTTLHDNPQLAGSVVKVTAKDLPGNPGTAEVTLQ
ncbi:hypothetical protein [Flavihumibacter petaseus]|uniref:Uncharacterized protein n=1 Tax=Flavihumibacter petaseus NBRC 106054 TaxID=1220578 RepID=A0A0E9N6M5_9BACT|nr:hypothetical protein [Flavihumibacter petaseus]GAO45602.1 hypothetical protein FPE01S_06_00930 [Flavihumibacter petaseus NBRC 106054]